MAIMAIIINSFACTILLKDMSVKILAKFLVTSQGKTHNWTKFVHVSILPRALYCHNYVALIPAKLPTPQLLNR